MRTAIFTAIIVLICGTAAAEFYRYTDKHGNVLFTDDLSKVPVEQRQSAQFYEDAPNKEVTAQDAADRKEKAETGAADSLEAERKQLEQREQELVREYQELTSERDALDRDKGNAVTPEQIKAYNSRIENFNTRTREYQKNQATHSEKVKSFNERLNSAPARR